MTASLAIALQILKDHPDADGVEWSEGQRVYRICQGETEPTEITDEDELAEFWAQENERQCVN